MRAIYVKELRQYFTSMIGYTYLTVFLLISGLIFTRGNLLSQSGDIKSYFAAISQIVIFLIPVLTMRLFSEERKMRTLQLLFSMPVSLAGIVWGKFLATLTIFCAGLACTLLYPLIISFYGSLELMVVLGNYAGMILLVSACISIGLFISTLTGNQIISAAASYSVLLVLRLLDSTGGPLRYLSLDAHFRDFTYGIFNPASIVFYLTTSGLFLLLSVIVIDGRKTA